MDSFYYLCTIKINNKTYTVMKAKKTIAINEMISKANELLSLPQSEIITKDFKYGVISMLETMLLRTNNYNGFMFLDKDDCDINTFGATSRKYFTKD